MKRLLLVLGFVLLSDTISVVAAPTPVIYQATGLTPAGIQPVVDEFRRDISQGGTDNGNLPGPLPNGRREIDWEQPQGSGFLIFPEKGALFTSGPWFTLQVSSNTPPLNFSNIDPSYLNTFQPFGSPRMMASVLQTAGIGTVFGIPAPEWHFPREAAYVNSVGIVFSDVDLPGSAYVHLFLSDSPWELRFEVPARPGDGTLSFLGISFGDYNWIQGVAIQAGNAALAPGQLDGTIVEPGPFLDQTPFVTDLVTIDRVIFSEPLVPEPSTMSLGVLGLLILIARMKLCRRS